MKKKRIIGIVLVLLIIALGVIVFFKVIKKDYSDKYVAIQDSSEKLSVEGIVKKLDINADDIAYINDKYIIYSNGSYYNVVDYNMKMVLENKNYISYNPYSDCYVVDEVVNNSKTQALYYKSFDEKGLLTKIGKTDRLLEKETIDGRSYYVTIDNNNNRKLYNPGYINGYALKDYNSIAVVDKFIVLDKELIDTENNKTYDVSKYYKVGNKYVIFHDYKTYLYDLETHKLDKYDKFASKNGYYTLDDKFLSNDGLWLNKDNKDKRRITDMYYIDYSACDRGFALYKKNKRYNDQCYQSVRRIGNKVLIGATKETERIAIFDNNRLVETTNMLENFGNLVKEYDKDKEKYYNKSGLLKNECDSSITVNTVDSFVCTKENAMYFMDESFKKVSDVYDEITCFPGSICVVKKNDKYGISDGKKLLTDINYPNLTYVYEGAFFVSRAVRNQLLILGEKDILNNVKYEDFETNIDISKTIKDYHLENIKSYIDKDPELFKRYAYVVLNNKSLNNYRNNVLPFFKVIQTNKKFLNEKEFLNSLDQLTITVKNVLSVDAAGLYYDSEPPKIEMIANKDYILRHEFMHFVDHRIGGRAEYVYRRVCRVGDKYYDSTKTDEDKCIYSELPRGTFIIEAGAETNAFRYFNEAGLAYNDSVLIYNAIAYLIGEQKMNDIFYGNNSEELLFLELNKYGVSLKSYTDFLSAISQWTSANATGYVSVKANAINGLTDFYYKKFGKSWAKDRVFSIYMQLLINWSDYYDYTKGVNLTAEEKTIVKQRFPLYQIVKAKNPNFSQASEGVLILVNNKYYLEYYAFIGKKRYRAVTEFDPKTFTALETKMKEVV